MQKFIHDNLDDLILHEKQLPDKYIALIPDLKELKTRIEWLMKKDQNPSIKKISF